MWASKIALSNNALAIVLYNSQQLVLRT